MKSHITSKKAPLRVLVAMQDSSYREQLLKNLRYFSIDPIIIDSFVGILKTLSQLSQYDILFLPVQLDAINGLEIVRFTQSALNSFNTFLVAVSKENSENNESKCKLAGFHEVFALPFSNESLAKILDKLSPQPTSWTDEDLFSQEKVAKLMINSDKVNRLVRTFEHQISESMFAINKNMKRFQFQELENDLLQLKQSCQNIGATAMIEIIKRMESKLRLGRKEELNQELLQLNQLSNLSLSNVKKVFQTA